MTKRTYGAKYKELVFDCAYCKERFSMHLEYMKHLDTCSKNPELPTYESK